MHLILLFCCAVLLSLCQIIDSSSSCPDGFSFHENSQKCFMVEKWTDKAISQMNARLTCAKTNAFLASIESDDENDFIRNLLMEKDAMIAYIGLQSVPYDVSQRYWCDGSTLDYTHWMKGKPDNGDFEDDGCVVMDANEGHWDDWTCKANEEIGPWAAVCQIKNHEETKYAEEFEDREEAFCPKGFEYCPSTKNCYKVVTAEKAINQMEAKDMCNEYNAHLVSIDSVEENQFVSDLAMKNPFSSMRVYIGLESDKADTDASKRQWVDGTAIEYLNWEHAKPDDEPYDDNNCVVMIPERGGVWDDWACADSCCTNHAVYGAVCEIDYDTLNSDLMI